MGAPIRTEGTGGWREGSCGGHPTTRGPWVQHGSGTPLRHPGSHGWGVPPRARAVSIQSSRHHGHSGQSAGDLHSKLALFRVQHKVKGPSSSFGQLSQHDILADPLHVVHLSMSRRLNQNINLQHDNRATNSRNQLQMLYIPITYPPHTP